MRWVVGFVYTKNKRTKKRFSPKAPFILKCLKIFSIVQRAKSVKIGVKESIFYRKNTHLRVVSIDNTLLHTFFIAILPAGRKELITCNYNSMLDSM